MNPPPIHVIKERIDDQMSALVASCHVVVRRELHGIGVFLLVNAAELRDWQFDWRAAGADRLKECLAKDHGGRLPYIGPAHSVE